MTTDTLRPSSLAPGEGTPMSWFDATMALKASTPDLGAVEVRVRPGSEPPLHVHSREDEWFFVVAGRAAFHVGDETYEAGPGAMVTLPRGIPHTFTVRSDEAHLLMLNAPGGFERMFELAPSSEAEAMQAFERYGVRAVGPHPRDAAV